jgi:hypothetical protein
MRKAWGGSKVLCSVLGDLKSKLTGTSLNQELGCFPFTLLDSLQDF